MGNPSLRLSEVLLHTFLSFADFFQNQLFEKFFTIRVSNSLDLDQARHSIGPDLGPNCLQKVISKRHY